MIEDVIQFLQGVLAGVPLPVFWGRCRRYVDLLRRACGDLNVHGWMFWGRWVNVLDILTHIRFLGVVVWE
jgi:hypothetical protein